MAFQYIGRNMLCEGAYTKCVNLGAHQAINMNRPSSSEEHSAADQQPLNETASHYVSRIMRPTEVAEATKDYPDPIRKLVAGHWTLCGDVSAEMFALIRTSTTDYLPTRLTGFRSSDGVGYGVVTHQVEGYQHRSVLCLYDPSVREFLEATVKDKLFFMLGNDNGDEAILLGSPLKPVEFIPLLAMSANLNEDEQREAVLELPALMSTMGNPLQVPSIFGGQLVRQVSVSLLLPSILSGTLRTSLRNATKK